jgi:Ran GTPase-activating protein (RanGAP) involved in mRNA processing and transport
MIPSLENLQNLNLSHNRFDEHSLENLFGAGAKFINIYPKLVDLMIPDIGLGMFEKTKAFKALLKFLDSQTKIKRFSFGGNGLSSSSISNILGSFEITKHLVDLTITDQLLDDKCMRKICVLLKQLKYLNLSN